MDNSNSNYIASLAAFDSIPAESMYNEKIDGEKIPPITHIIITYTGYLQPTPKPFYLSRVEKPIPRYKKFLKKF